jgi:mRNA interferase RelE/StbE
MAYTVELTARAARDLRAIPRPDQVRIARRLDGLAENPRPYGVRKLEGEEDLSRIRVGDFRVIYTVLDRRLVVLVIRVGHRRDVYRS